MSPSRIAAAALAVASVAAATIAVAAPAGNVAAGKKVFDNQCSLCHTLVNGQSSMGPELNGVVGRKAASVAGFTYSRQLKAKSSVVWTAATLDQYLQDPQKFAPGSSMPINLPGAKDRADVIAFLATTK